MRLLGDMCMYIASRIPSQYPELLRDICESVRVGLKLSVASPSKVATLSHGSSMLTLFRGG